MAGKAKSSAFDSTRRPAHLSLRTQFVLQRATIQGPSMVYPAVLSQFAVHTARAVGRRSSDMMDGLTSYKLFGYRCIGTVPKNCCSCALPAELRAATYAVGKRLVRTLAVLRRPTGCVDAARGFVTLLRVDSFLLA